MHGGIEYFNISVRLNISSCYLARFLLGYPQGLRFTAVQFEGHLLEIEDLRPSRLRRPL